jgi:hypothetical protein
LQVLVTGSQKRFRVSSHWPEVQAAPWESCFLQFGGLTEASQYWPKMHGMAEQAAPAAERAAQVGVAGVVVVSQ